MARDPLDEALFNFREYRYRVGRTIHDLGGAKYLATEFGPLGDAIEAEIATLDAARRASDAQVAGLREFASNVAEMLAESSSGPFLWGPVEGTTDEWLAAQKRNTDEHGDAQERSWAVQSTDEADPVTVAFSGHGPKAHRNAELIAYLLNNAPAIAALATTPAPQPDREEFAWLIERGQPEKQVPTVWLVDQPIRWGVTVAPLRWTTDGFEATRFPSKEAAEAWMAEHSGYVPSQAFVGRAVEYGFAAPAPQPATPRGLDWALDEQDGAPQPATPLDPLAVLRDVRSRIPADQHVALAAIGEAITAIEKGAPAMQSTEPKPFEMIYDSNSARQLLKEFVEYLDNAHALTEESGVPDIEDFLAEFESRWDSDAE